jgi:hypothetical protein
VLKSSVTSPPSTPDTVVVEMSSASPSASQQVSKTPQAVSRNASLSSVTSGKSLFGVNHFTEVPLGFVPPASPARTPIRTPIGVGLGVGGKKSKRGIEEMLGPEGGLAEAVEIQSTPLKKRKGRNV